MIVRELPTSKIDREALRELSIAMANEAAESFPEYVATLQKLFRSVFPPSLLAIIACWGMSSPVGPDGTTGKGMIEGVEQHHIELLQALLLTIGRWEWGAEPATPSDIQTAIDTVKAVCAAFHKQRLHQLDQTHAPDALVVIGLQELTRDHTQMVRNWGYYDDMLRIVRAWHEPLDALLQAHHGFSGSDLISTAERLVESHQKRLGERFILLKDIFKGRTKKKIVQDFFARYEGVEGDPAELLHDLPKRMSLRQLRIMLQSHADQWLMMEMLIDPSIIATQTGLPVAKVISILRSLSMVPGCLKSADTQHLFLANPVWQRPGLQDGDDFLFFIPQSMPAFLPVILRELCEKAGIVDDLDSRKSAYLEEEIGKIVQAALPSACVKSSVKWHWQGVQYETDVLAVFERTLLIVEAKSGSVSSSALRGAPLALKQHVQRLIVEPAMQSARLQEIVELASKGDMDALAVALGLNIDPHKTDAVVRISVTLDDLSPMAMSEFELKRAGWIPQNLKLPPTLNLAELGTCADILSNSRHFLNYFAARERLQGATRIFGYEMDYLGLYLENGLELPELSAGTHIGRIDGMSSAIDRYYLSRDTGSPVTKPEVMWA
jgi:hypothetical protein